jgi:gamma-F420-2:alpha-L-glutamate ligase
MKLIVVYGLKTGDYDWLAGFYPARRLAEACENRGIPLRFLFSRDVSAFLADACDNAFSPDRAIALVRGNVDASVYAELEAAGYRCINDSRAVALARDKLETSRFLTSHGYPTPETLSLADAARQVDSLTFPLVVKPRFGSRGEGVALVRDGDALLKRVALSTDAAAALPAAAGLSAGANAVSGEYIAQRFIESSRGRDVRVFFAGGDVLAVAGRTNADDALLSNACAGGVTSSLTGEWFGKWATMTLDIAREAGLWYGTVDWLYDGDGMTVCEINSSPGFESLEKACDLDIAGAIVERLAHCTL